MRFLIILFLAFGISCYGAESVSKSIEELSRRVHAHILIGDYQSALKEAKANLSCYPDSLLSYEMLLRAHASLGNEEEMLQTWALILDKFPNNEKERFLLEEMCLGILKKGCESESLTTRLIGFLAIAKSQLPEAVALIKKGLGDSNALLRALNVELASLYADKPLQEEILELFKTEKSVEVRCEILKAIVKLKLKELIPELIHSLEKKHKMAAKEKKATILALAELREEITSEELKKLIKSGRSWEIELACALMRKWHMVNEADLLIPLIEKSPKEVKVEAIKTIGYLQRGDISVLEKACYDDDPLVGITASWAIGFLDFNKMEKAFSHWFAEEKKSIIYMACAALMMHGKKAIPIAEKYLKNSSDPYVKANLALSFLKLRFDTEENADILYCFLHDTKDKLMWVEDFFPYLQKSTVSHSPLVPNLPEATNQKMRLEILNLLAIVEYKKAEDALREFLKETRWELAGEAAETILQEGDETAIALVKNLLHEEDKHLKSQAALLLALWGKDSDAMECLTEIYKTGDRSLKIKVLEALGFIGDANSIPFLIECLKEPSSIIRLVAACTLLQTLYH